MSEGANDDGCFACWHAGAGRYSYQSYPYCVLRNEAGLPAMPFTANITHTNPL